MNNLCKIVILIILLSFSVYPQNLDLPFENYSVDEGMPSVVNYILQDKIGYLWFATNSGLYKYDGYSFTFYKHDLDNTNSLIDNSLTTLYEDKGGILWIGTWLGIEKYNRINNTFIHYTPNPSTTGNSKSNNVWTICEENGYIESFNGKLRDELLNGEIFDTILEAKVITENWRNHYNQKRPHSSLGYRVPAPEAILPIQYANA